jgi:dienelactone hydrolase
MTISATIRRMLPAILAVALALLSNPAQADLKKGWIDYSHGSKKLKGYVVHDDAKNGKRPGVLMIHGQDGMSSNTRLLAETFAKFGYISFATDIFGFGEGVLPKDVPEMQQQTKIYRGDRALMRARTQAGFDALAAHPLVDSSRIAVIGFCFGGDVGFEFGATGAPLLLNVAIHGSFSKYQPGWAKNVKGQVLILHGSEDKPYPLTVVNGVIDELRTAQVPFGVEIYGNVGHGFYKPTNKAEERALKLSIASTGRYLAEVFGD